MNKGYTPQPGRTKLETEAAVALPDADQVASLFPVTLNQNLTPDNLYQAAIEALDFGTAFGDYMAVETWTVADGWHDRKVEAYGPLSLSPAMSVLHYGQEIFEGMKAYRWEDGSVWTFRPGFNAARLNHSARRMAMPEISLDDFIGSLVQTVRQDERWVPWTPDSSLYLRPFMIASEPFLGVRSAKEYLYMVISTPVGPYFKGGLKPVSIWMSTDYHRAAPGGTGSAKTGGNYASSLLPQTEAAALGYDQVCYLDASDNAYLEELGGMNVFVVMADGTVKTPALSGSILEGVTRSSVIELLQDRGITVTEERIALTDLLSGIADGSVQEMFACGTAAVITPIGTIGGLDFKVDFPGTTLTESLYRELYGIQRGTVEDRHNWMYRLA